MVDMCTLVFCIKGVRAVVYSEKHVYATQNFREYLKNLYFGSKIIIFVFFEVSGAILTCGKGMHPYISLQLRIGRDF